jgi:hypothetical protein
MSQESQIMSMCRDGYARIKSQEAFNKEYGTGTIITVVLTKLGEEKFKTIDRLAEHYKIKIDVKSL